MVMSSVRKLFPWSPSPATLIAAALVIGGLALLGVRGEEEGRLRGSSNDKEDVQ